MLGGRSWASSQVYRKEINEIPRVSGVPESALGIRWVGAGKVPTDGSGQVGGELANGKRVIANRSIVVAGTFVPTIKYWTHRLIKYLHGSQWKKKTRFSYEKAFVYANIQLAHTQIAGMALERYSWI